MSAQKKTPQAPEVNTEVRRCRLPKASSPAEREQGIKENESEVDSVMRDMVKKHKNTDRASDGIRTCTLSARKGLVLAFALTMTATLSAALAYEAAAATAGPNTPTTGANNSAVGTTSWSSAGNVRSSDNVDASASLSGGRTSNYLAATGFGFAIPSNAVVNGIKVDIERAEGSKSSSAYIRDNSVKIVKNGSVTGTEHANTSANWPTSDKTASYGSSTDLWGVSWTPADINANSFGAVLSVKNTSSSSSETAYVDNMRITVYYTEAASCTASAPTVSMIPASQSITTDGGTITYAATITNNDNGTGCANVTYTLAPADTNTANFNASTVSPASLTIGAGSTGTATLTVAATSGQTSGSNTTTLTASASGHTSGSGSVTTTLDVFPCTTSAPTLQISPAAQLIAASETVSYVIVLTNNDSSGCGTTAFALSVTGDSNSAAFSVPSILTAATLAVNPGQSATSTLTVTAKPGATDGLVNTTTVAVTGSGHTSPPAVIVVTTVNTGAVRKEMMIHNSVNTGSGKWASEGGWGVTGGKYGRFTCTTCHGEEQNIKLIKNNIIVPDTSKGNIPGSSVNFQSTTGPNGFGDDSDNHSVSQKICEVCHTVTSYHRYDTGSQTGGKSHYNSQDCTTCHKHKNGFKGGDCIGCHSQQQGSRAAVVGQFSGASHHIQGVALTNQMCYQCHWEANADGSVNSTYHGGSNNPGAPVRLVIYGSTSRPTTYAVGTTAVEYTANGTRGELQKINQVCLGCHDDDSASAQPFGDGKTPKQYAWDGTSVAARYSQTASTTWGKYTSYTGAAAKNITKAYSAHGNASTNLRGWTAANGYDGAIPNTSGAISVLCFDCHNSHGSTVAGITTSYTSASANGGILKDTAAGQGGYTMAYKPRAGGSSADKNVYNPGAALCFDCHLTAVAGTTPWGYQSTYGASQVIMGYFDTSYFGPGATGPQQRYTYKASAGQPKGGHFGASASLNTPANGTIGGLCTPCHDPHGVTPALGANQQYGVPLLKGTWLTSPYKEDAAPLSKTEARGGGHDRSALNVGSTPGYHIDQNTFANLATTSPWTWNFSLTTRVSQTPEQFAGLCLNCHPKKSIAPSTDSTWKSVDRVHNTVNGWGTFGGNAGNAVHGYTCSKCHAPHNSSLARLMVTNCLDFTHRGRVASGGTVRSGTNAYTGQQSAGDGRGNGRFPGGGGGFGDDEPRGWSRGGGAYFFGIAGTSTAYPSLRQCHDGPNTAETWPAGERWNVRTPW